MHRNPSLSTAVHYGLEEPSEQVRNQNRLKYLRTKVETTLFAIPKGTVIVAAQRLQDYFDSVYPGTYIVSGGYEENEQSGVKWGMIRVMFVSNKMLYFGLLRNFK